MSTELKRLEKLYNLFLEFDKYMRMLGEDFETENLMTVELDSENEIIYVNEDNNGFENLDSTGFKMRFSHYLDGADELIDNTLSDLDYEYNKVVDGIMTEEEYIHFAGVVHLIKCKLDDISNEYRMI